MLLARSQRMTNGKLRAAGWAPKYRSVREGFAATAQTFRRLTSSRRGQRILNSVFGALFIAVAALLMLVH